MRERITVRPDQLLGLAGAARLGRGRVSAQAADLRPPGDLEPAQVGLGQPPGVGRVAQAGQFDARRLGRVGRA